MDAMECNYLGVSSFGSEQQRKDAFLERSVCLYRSSVASSVQEQMSDVSKAHRAHGDGRAHVHRQVFGLLSVLLRA